MNGNALKFLIFLSVTFGIAVTTRPRRTRSYAQSEGFRRSVPVQSLRG
jgi:hypothetical protein